MKRILIETTTHEHLYENATLLMNSGLFIVKELNGRLHMFPFRNVIRASEIPMATPSSQK